MVAIGVSGGILGVLLAQAVSLTQGFSVSHALDALVWIAGVIVLYRKPKELAVELGLSVAVAAAYQWLFPYWG